MPVTDKSSTTYADEMSQPVHKPGMESVVNRGTPDTDKDGNRTGPRRTVSPPTQSAFGPASASDPAPASPKPSAAPTPDPDSAAGIGGKAREATVMGQVDQAVKG
jgi:hypothetical protein